MPCPVTDTPSCFKEQRYKFLKAIHNKGYFPLNSDWYKAYNTTSILLGSPEAASKFLNERMGFVGIHYDGRSDGECYVIFDENDAKIVDHVMFSIAPAAKEQRLLNDEEKTEARAKLESTTPIDVKENQITKEEGKTISATANEWAEKNIPEPRGYNTEAGKVFIDKRSVKDSVSHGVGQAKLDAITSLVDGFENATYMGSMTDSNGIDLGNHYFAYPINYKGAKNYVFCRTREDENTHRLYVHEVFLESELKKDAHHTAASEKPHGGILLYRDILSDVLNAKVQQNSESATENENNLYSVTPQQDAAYMDAVSRGDMETAQRMVNEAAKRAMPDTKVVDENGNPMVVIHRSPNVVSKSKDTSF